jgi:hypothetical protein
LEGGTAMPEFISFVFLCAAANLFFLIGGIATPEFISLRDSCALFPSEPSLNTVVRWASRGINGVQLKTVKFAGRRLTTVGWVEEFIRQTIDSSNDSYKSAGQTVAHQVAEERLVKMGVVDRKNSTKGC